MLPPMVVFKQLNGSLYPAWCLEGPTGSVFAATTSGWFDHTTFAQWFESVRTYTYLPTCRHVHAFSNSLVLSCLSWHILDSNPGLQINFDISPLRLDGRRARTRGSAPAALCRRCPPGSRTRRPPSGATHSLLQVFSTQPGV